jgi:iron complex outermembrane recepter protein
MMQMQVRWLLIGVSSSMIGMVGVAAGQEHTLEEVVVTGESESQPTAASAALLDVESQTGNRLGLSVRETPAVIDTLTAEQMQDLGVRATDEALNRAPGLSSSSIATSPGELSLRGFTGAGRGVVLLYDDVSPLETSLFTRIMDSFMFDRIEVLQGPGSVDYGQGALAGAVNLVPKHPRLGVNELQALLGYGSFGTLRAGADANVTLLERLAVRPVVSFQRSSGYVNDTQSSYIAATLGAKWAPVERLSIDVALDYSRDDYDTAYLGTPLVPRMFARDPSDLVTSEDGRVLDKRMRSVNFNVRDAVLDANSVWLRSTVDYQISDGWSVSNRAHYFSSDRMFKNAEYFGFDPDSERVQRSTGIVTHDIAYFIDRLVVRGDTKLGRLRNRLAFGGEYSTVDYFTERRFGDTAAVDPYAPMRGLFPAGDNAMVFGRRQDRDNQVQNGSLFVQDALSLTPRWRITAGARYDHLRVRRNETDLNADPEELTRVRRTYNVVTWRAGTSFDLLEKTQLFAQYSTAASPPSSLVSLPSGETKFRLTRGWSAEAGVKSTLLDERVVLGASGFYIAQDDILTRDPRDLTVSVQGGGRSSYGAELTASAVVLPSLRIDANFVVLDARYDQLRDSTGIDLSGNTPARVPEQILNAFAFYDTPLLPMTVSAGVHYAGRYFTDDANSIEVASYATVEAALRYRLRLDDLTLDFTLRGRNLTDTFYATFTDMSPDQLQIAPPRSVDLLVAGRY